MKIAFLVFEGGKGDVSLFVRVLGQHPFQAKVVSDHTASELVLGPLYTPLTADQHTKDGWTVLEV